MEPNILMHIVLPALVGGLIGGTGVTLFQHQLQTSIGESAEAPSLSLTFGTLALTKQA